MTAIALRMDDVGASSKRYEVYSNWQAGVGPLRVSGNWLFLKYLQPFKAWAPYPELNAGTWRGICDLLTQYSARLTVAVTAGWVESADRIVPFPDRFPQEAEVIRQGVTAGVLEIANHGLTHCVVEGERFRPRWFTSNRTFHREFWDWVPLAIQDDHLRRSQEILRATFGDVVTFVPPGNVFTDGTLELAASYGLRYVSCATAPGLRHGLAVIGNQHVEAFHDRDIALHGLGWLRQCLERHRDRHFCFVRELGETARHEPAVAPTGGRR